MKKIDKDFVKSFQEEVVSRTVALIMDKLDLDDLEDAIREKFYDAYLEEMTKRMNDMADVCVEALLTHWLESQYEKRRD
jgi:hypothetical protein